MTFDIQHEKCHTFILQNSILSGGLRICLINQKVLNVK